MLTEDQIRLIVEEQKATLRRCRTMLAGFKATKEKDLEYMYPEEAQDRFRELEDRLGYWTPAVIAAGMVAREIHRGQKDKGGHDYFESHLLPVAKSGNNWKEKIVGFLHDATEDTEYSSDAIIEKVESTLHELTSRKDDGWKEEFNLIPSAGNSTFFPSEKDWEEIKEALACLNHNTAPDRASYIRRFRDNKLALKVKLNDMRNNMDISRIPSPTPRDLERLERYKAEYRILTEMLNGIER